MEELQEALKEKGLITSSLPEKGRCLFTTREFSPGEVIISENPYVCVPNKNKESPQSKCEWCFSSTSLKKCSACHVVWYCSSKCQRSDWKLHSVECNILSKVDKGRLKSLTPSIRLMVKLCMRRKLENEKIFPTFATENYKHVEALVSHMSDVDEEQLLLYAQMANLVNLILQWPDSQINIKEITEFFSKLACNAHTICDGELRPLGTGLYPVISIINHSCLPNSVLVFEGRQAVVRAMQNIQKGTEVLISYVDIAGSTLTRQKALKEQYYFSCVCSRCVKLGQSDDIKESAILEGYKCKDSKCDGFLLRGDGALLLTLGYIHFDLIFKFFCSSEVISLALSYLIADNKGFICQQCGLLRDKEEIAKITKEVKSISEKASMSLSCGRILEPVYLDKFICSYLIKSLKVMPILVREGSP
ncbi:hypothetical protein ACS0TY_028277 [Phlomoides rotata]